MDRTITVNGQKGNFMGREYSFGLIKKNTKVIGKMEFKKELEKQIILMVENTWENIKMVKKMDLVSGLI